MGLLVAGGGRALPKLQEGNGMELVGLLSVSGKSQHHSGSLSGSVFRRKEQWEGGIIITVDSVYKTKD